MKKRYYLVVGIILLLVIAAVPYFVYFDKPTRFAPSHVAVPVATTVVSTAKLDQTVSAVGTLIAKYVVAVSPEIAGQVAKVLFQQGAYVNIGAPLIQLDNTVYVAQLKAAQADLALSKIQYQRFKKLAAEGAQPKEILDRAKADLEDKQSQVNVDQAMVNRTLLRAPFSGFLGVKNVHVGQHVQIGQSLVTLVDKKHLKVEYRVAERYLPKLKLGQAIVVRVPGETMRFHGYVSFISPQVDESTRSVELQADVDNTNEQLTPGEYVKVTQTLGVDPKAVVIPEEALVPRLGEQIVYRVINHKAVVTKVIVGKRYNQLVNIISGVTPGDVVITKGQQNLSDSALVKIVNEKSR